MRNPLLTDISISSLHLAVEGMHEEDQLCDIQFSGLQEQEITLKVTPTQPANELDEVNITHIYWDLMGIF